MSTLAKTDVLYAAWLKKLKSRIRSVQIKAALHVNTEMLNFYWDLGADIVQKQTVSKWGEGFLSNLSRDLMEDFPEVKGFSRRNLELIRKWHLFWAGKGSIAKQLVSQLPWGHNILLVTRCKNINEATFYIQKSIEHGWSRAVLTHQMEIGLFKREGKAITNFKTTLPEPQSDLARQTLKDPYSFDFLALRERHDERELEDALMSHVTRFLLELGAGFSFLGRQYRIEVKGDEYFIDLLFYHVRLHCYVVVELKAVKFKPEFAGKLNFYISAVDGLLKAAADNPTIGILICKSKNDTVVEYSLKDIQKPIGVSEYVITRSLPKEFKSSLPSIEDIEAELGGGEV